MRRGLNHKSTQTSSTTWLHGHFSPKLHVEILHLLQRGCLRMLVLFNIYMNKFNMHMFPIVLGMLCTCTMKLDCKTHLSEQPSEPLSAFIMIGVHPDNADYVQDFR